MTYPAYRQQLLEEVQLTSESSFGRHVLTEEGNNRWLFSRPGDSNMHFRVVIVPGFIFMGGDCGELILQVYERNPLGWLRGVLDRPDYSVHYVASKISQDIKSVEFQQALVDDFIREIRMEAVQLRKDGEHKLANMYRLFAKNIREARDDRWSHSFNSADDFYEAAYEDYGFNEEYRRKYGHQAEWPGHDDLPRVEGLSRWTLVKLEGLRYFVAALERQISKAALDTQDSRVQDAPTPKNA